MNLIQELTSNNFKEQRRHMIKTSLLIWRDHLRNRNFFRKLNLVLILKLGFILTWKMHHWQTHLFTVQSIFSPISYHFDIMTNWPFPSAMQARSQQLGTIAKLNYFWKYCILSKAFKRRYLYLGIRIFRWRLSSAIRFIGELRRRMMIDEGALYISGQFLVTRLHRRTPAPSSEQFPSLVPLRLPRRTF